MDEHTRKCVLLDPDDVTSEYVGKMFREDRLIVCPSNELLPQKLGSVLRAIRGI